jgi:hypothetical protein
MTLPPVSLTDSAQRVAHHAAAILQIETEAQRKTLLPRLLIGLHCLKAHTMFALVDASKRNKKGKNQHSKGGLVTHDEASTDSYENWLATASPTLKKPTTYKYMSAVRGLGCDENSTEEELTTVFETYTNPTLAMLCNAAPEPVQPPTDPPAPVQLEFDLITETLHAYRESCEELLNNKDSLATFPKLHKAAVARIYQTLHELTGQHWQPSEEPSDYAHINPDSIEL